MSVKVAFQGVALEVIRNAQSIGYFHVPRGCTLRVCHQSNVT